MTKRTEKPKKRQKYSLKDLKWLLKLINVTHKTYLLSVLFYSEYLFMF